MSFIKTWYTLDEAESKFGVERKLILQWVEDGLVRSELEQFKVARVNGDDLELNLSNGRENTTLSV